MAGSVTTYKTHAKRKKRKLKKTVKIKLQIFAILIITAFIVYIPVKRKINSVLHPAPLGMVSVDQYKDFNAIHLYHAKINGTKPFKTNSDFDAGIGDLVKTDKLVKIKDNGYYRICDLTHSHPYLTPKAKDFLDDLGKRFREKLDKKGMPDYYFQISSLLRTKENQSDLSRSNINATTISSHMYGTTFDIPYTTVVKRTLFWKEAEVTDGNASKLLSETLGELRKEDRCVIVTERKEACFHITIK
jgi:hypothetical protein